MKLVYLSLLSLALGGCAALPFAGAAAGGAAAGWLVVAQSAVKEANTGLAIIRPINQALCIVEEPKPHTPVVAAAIKAFCANLPTDVGGLLIQAAAVFLAIDLESHPI